MSTQVHTGIVPSAGATPEGRSGNTLGRMTCLTLFTSDPLPVEPGGEARLWLGKYLPMAQNHILQFDFIHFVRWTIVRELPHSGGAERARA